jgi:hypothetical protein
MLKRQRGITFLGLVILVGFLGIFVYAGIQLIPAYLNFMKVNKALADLKTEIPGTITQAVIVRTLEKRFEIEDVALIDAKTVEITHEESGWTVHAGYDDVRPFLFNVSFLVHFDKSVVLQSGG